MSDDQPIACGYQLADGDICGLNANHTGWHRDGSPMDEAEAAKSWQCTGCGRSHELSAPPYVPRPAHMKGQWPIDQFLWGCAGINCHGRIIWATNPQGGAFTPTFGPSTPAPGPSEEDDGSAVLTVELSQSQADRLLKGSTLEGDLTPTVGPATLKAMASLVNDGEPMIYQVRVAGTGVMSDDQDKAVGGSDVCVTCSAHCTEIECLLAESAAKDKRLAGLAGLASQMLGALERDSVYSPRALGEFRLHLSELKSGEDSS